MEENMVAIRDPNFFHFDFVWPKDTDENLKHKFEFVVNSNDFLAENKIKNEIEQFLLK